VDLHQSGLHTVTGWPGSGRPAHAARPWQPRIRVATAVGIVLLLAAMGAAAASCLGSLGPSKSTPTSASLITVTPAIDTAAQTP
jgi:hypothetical protein